MVQQTCEATEFGTSQIVGNKNESLISQNLFPREYFGAFSQSDTVDACKERLCGLVTEHIFRYFFNWKEENTPAWRPELRGERQLHY